MQCTRACWRSAEQAPVPGARLLWLWGRGGDQELAGLQTGPHSARGLPAVASPESWVKSQAVRPCPTPEAERLTAALMRT